MLQYNAIEIPNTEVIMVLAEDVKVIDYERLRL